MSKFFLCTFVALTLIEQPAMSDPDPAHHALPLFLAGGGLMYTDGSTSMSTNASTTNASSNVIGGEMWIALCGCGDIAIGPHKLAIGVYGDFTLGVNAATSAALLASLSFGPQVTFKLSGDELEAGVRYRASVNANGARDVGGADDEYLLDVLGRYRNMGFELRRAMTLFPYPLFGRPSHPMERVGAGVWYRIPDGKISSYYLRLDVDHFSPDNDKYTDYAGNEVRAFFGWALGF